MDDLALLFHSYAQMQDKTICLESTSAKIGLHINNGKTKIMRMQHASNCPVTVAGKPLEEVTLTYLGKTVDTNREAGGLVGVGGGRFRCEGKNRRTKLLS